MSIMRQPVGFVLCALCRWLELADVVLGRTVFGDLLSVFLPPPCLLSRSWREFPHPDEEDVEGAESREHRRWIERNNSKVRN